MNGGNGQEHNFFRRPLVWLVVLVVLLIVWLIFLRGRVSAPPAGGTVSPEEAAVDEARRQQLLESPGGAPAGRVIDEDRRQQLLRSP